MEPCLRQPRNEECETFPHGADVGVRGRGATIADAFANAAVALTSVITDPAAVRATQSVDLHVAAADAELPLVEWLHAVIAAMATQRFLFRRFAVAIDGQRLRARAFGEPVDRLRHQPAGEGKGSTLTALRAARDELRRGAAFASAGRGAGCATSRNAALRRWQGTAAVAELTERAGLCARVAELLPWVCIKG